MEQLLQETSNQDEKPGVWEEIVKILRRILRWCICCLTCGCVNIPETAEIQENMQKLNIPSSEQTTLLGFLRKLKNGRNAFVDESELQILAKIALCENIRLQRVAALCYSQLSEYHGFTLTLDSILPLVRLLNSNKTKVHKPACSAVSKFLIRSEKIRRMLVDGGIIDGLRILLSSDDSEVLVTATSSIASLSTSDTFKRQLVFEDVVSNLLPLMNSTQVKVQRNVVGSLLNLTHDPYLLDEIVHDGAIPPLVNLLTSKNQEILYYTTAILCNLATNEKHRTMIMAVGFCDAVRHMFSFIANAPVKLQCQACLTLRNFTMDDNNQSTVMKMGVLDVLQCVIKRENERILVPSLSLLQSLSAYPSNWDEILDLDMHVVLCDIIPDSSNSEAQMHAAIILRNLATSDKLGMLVDAGCVRAMGIAIIEPLTITSVLVEITATLAVVCRDEEARLQLVEIQNGALFSKLVAMASISSSREIQYNAAGVLGQISLTDLPNHMKQNNAPGLFVFIDNFLKSSDSDFVHIALLTLVQLLKDYYFSRMFQRQHIGRVVTDVAQSSHPPEITNLALSIAEEMVTTQSPK